MIKIHKAKLEVLGLDFAESEIKQYKLGQNMYIKRETESGLFSHSVHFNSEASSYNDHKERIFNLALALRIWFSPNLGFGCLFIGTKPVQTALLDGFRLPNQGYKNKKITDSDRKYFTPIYDNITACLNEHRAKKTFSRLGRALGLFNYSYYQYSHEIKFLNIVMALESLFTTAAQEVTYRLKINLSNFLGENSAERMRIYDTVEKILNVRGPIAHGGKPEKDKIKGYFEKNPSNFENLIGEAEELLINAFRKILWNSDTLKLFSGKDLGKYFIKKAINA
jgi:hypothetical protein